MLPKRNACVPSVRVKWPTSHKKLRHLPIPSKSTLTDGRMRTLNYQFNWGGRGYLTFALFILGLVVGRIRFFRDGTPAHSPQHLTIRIVCCRSVDYRSNERTPCRKNIPLSCKVLPLCDSAFPHDVERCEYGSFSAAITMGFVILYHMKGIGKCLNLLTLRAHGTYKLRSARHYRLHHILALGFRLHIRPLACYRIILFGNCILYSTSRIQ